jgi:hypothetical protein
VVASAVVVVAGGAVVVVGGVVVVGAGVVVVGFAVVVDAGSADDPHAAISNTTATNNGKEPRDVARDIACTPRNSVSEG